ncbi:MAG TPA: gliding motility lipoprotein GldD [Prolixibacteraceae bacterium]|nr:gliding motility lipoprotein GldD [Prolixibacteraceae bacterium]
MLLILLLCGCKHDYAPKPRGYFRIDFPEKNYLLFQNTFPYRFEYPVYAQVVPDKEQNAEPFWIDINIPGNKAKFHLSYKPVKGNLVKLIEDSRELAYKHTIKAMSINEETFINSQAGVYGTIYYIKGNAASPMQFYMTDSTSHFLRGSFYISEVPNYDSLMPVIQFLETDMIHLIKTLNWN